jgi:hypothetical protein
MIPLRVTTENAGHTHTIMNPGTGFTDTAADGHKHGLVKGCQTCQKIRATLKVEVVPTTFVAGHLHFLNSGSLTL